MSVAAAVLAAEIAARVLAVERHTGRAEPREAALKAVIANVSRVSEEAGPDGRLRRVWLPGPDSLPIGEAELRDGMRRLGSGCGALRRLRVDPGFLAGMDDGLCAIVVRALTLDALAAARVPPERRAELRYDGAMPTQPGLRPAEGWDLFLSYARRQATGRAGREGAAWAAPEGRADALAALAREAFRRFGEAAWRRAMERAGPEDVWVTGAAMEAALDELLPAARGGPVAFRPRSGAPLACPEWTAEAARRSRGPWTELERVADAPTARDLDPLSPWAAEALVERALALAAASLDRGAAAWEGGLLSPPPPGPGEPPLFRAVPEAESGLSLPPREAPRDDRLTDQMPGGMAVLDYDGDGRPDLFACDFDQVRLFRNLGGLRFRDEAGAAGLGGLVCRNGASSEDYDGDGRPDLLLLHARDGSDRLLHNEGGRFRDATVELGLSTAPAQSTSAVWLDYDGDGRPDLFLLEYGDLAFADREPAPGDAKNGRGHRLYRGLGGRFVDVSTAAGVADTGWGLAGAAFDADGDGRTDLLAGNDFGRPVLYRNRGDGTFEDATAASGLDAYGNEMGAAVGDYDGDGIPDLFLTYIGDARPRVRPLFPSARPRVRTEPMDVRPQRNRLFRGLGGGRFEDRGADIDDLPTGWGWNGLFLDAANSGTPDLFLVNGWWPHRHFYDQDAKVFWRWDPATRRFRDLSERSGLDFAGNSRVSVYDDFDGDGCLDLVVTGFHAPRLFQGKCPKTNHWLELRLTAARGPRDGLGARATVRADGRSWTAELGAQGGGFQNGLRRVLRFGLGTAARYDSVEVAWPGGARTRLGPGGADRVLAVREGEER